MRKKVDLDEYLRRLDEHGPGYVLCIPWEDAKSLLGEVLEYRNGDLGGFASENQTM